MLDLENPFSYEEAHNVLRDGRIVEMDPVTGKWSRRPAGMAKEMWKRLPHMCNALQLLGPELFTVTELRGVSQAVDEADDLLAGPYAGELGNGLEDLDVYDTGPVVDENDGARGDPVDISEPSSSSTAPAAGRDLKGTHIMKRLRNYVRDARPVLQSNGPRWVGSYHSGCLARTN